MQSPEEARTLCRNSASAPLSLGGLPLVRAVSEYLQEALRGSVLVFQRHHLAAGPKAGPVLFLVPPLVVAAPMIQSALHFGELSAFLPVLQREKHAGRLTDHLLLGPAEDSVRALIPRGHQAVQVHCDNGIVGRTIQQRFQQARPVEFHRFVRRTIRHEPTNQRCMAESNQQRLRAIPIYILTATPRPEPGASPDGGRRNGADGKARKPLR